MCTMSVFSLVLITLVQSAPQIPSFTFNTNFATVRGMECIKQNNYGPACHDGAPDGKPDPGAVFIKGIPTTSCGNNALDTGIIGIHYGVFGAQTGGYSSQNLCGRKVTMTNNRNGKTANAVIMDRISQNNGPQVDLSSELNLALGGNGKDNILDSITVEVF